jgi:hypothetical protein
MQEAIVYVNSDLVSKLRYRMYLINFPKTYLQQFERILVGTIKRLAHLAKSTSTDLLICQGFYNVFNLQAVVRANFLQNCLQAPDMPCRISSQISYTHLRYSQIFKGVPPFGPEGLKVKWREQTHSPIFHGIKKHLLALDMSFFVNFDTPIDPQSRRIAATLTPLAYKHLAQLQEREYSVTLITRLFKNLATAGLHDLDDISPLFEHPIGNPTERWTHQKGRPTKSFAQVATDKTRVLHSHLQVDHASKSQMRLLANTVICRAATSSICTWSHHA